MARTLLAPAVVERLLELQGDPLAHHPDTIDRVDQGRSISHQKVPLCSFNHRT